MNTDLYNQVFDRQLKIEDWKQDKIKEQIVLVLGVGGIGSIALINLLRLGVKKVIIVDYDVVELHNINRQLLYTQKDVGVLKVKAARANGEQFYNVGGTIIEDHAIDAVKNWYQIVEFAKTSHAIFNCIDHGDYWDAAVQSLCFSLSIPHLIAGSFAQSFMAEIYFSQPCYACLDDMLKPEVLAELVPSKIQGLQNIDFMPKNNKPTGQSHIALCSTAGNFVTQHYINYVNQQENSNQTKKVLFYMTTFESVQFPLEANPRCQICGDPNAPLSIEQKSEMPLQQQQEVKEELTIEISIQPSQEQNE